ncbi:hypothetical protein [Shewanella putrefaciens]|uniref:hypothetical protein n=1 Tax=Shewanella putrefaciens TaxID=24 RepID=UPI003568C0E5
MSIYNISNKKLQPLEQTTFAAEGLQERYDLQEALKHSIDAIAPDCLIISDEFSDWEDSRRRIDLLAIDRNANLMVIELKRDDTGAHMELQALRYAAMIANMTFDKACEYFAAYIEQEGLQIDARKTLLEFTDLDESTLDDFGTDVRILLVSADFGKELTTSVLWLRDKGLDISCVRLTPFKYQGNVLINTEQIIPVPEAEAYQIKFREKRAEEKKSQTGGRDYSQFRYKGENYNKRNLALVLLTDWVEMNSPANLAALLSVFDRTIHPSGVASLLDEIKESRMNRYHSSNDSIIQLRSGECIAISNQWSIGSITQLINKMAEFRIMAEKVT